MRTQNRITAEFTKAMQMPKPSYCKQCENELTNVIGGLHDQDRMIAVFNHEPDSEDLKCRFFERLQLGL